MTELFDAMADVFMASDTMQVHDLAPDAILRALPAAIYTTDAEGRITFYNEAAAALWGVRPALGSSQFCGSWKLFWPDGRPLRHDECPMAVTLREKRAVRGVEAVAERPDGSRVPFMPYPTPLFDESGRLIGAVNMLVDLTDRRQAEHLSQWQASIVESSDDAILSKDLNGVITSWNRGAERLFGYRAKEIIGKPVTILIPEDRQDEEPVILARLRRGERIEHYETVRRRKDGSLVDISLTVSPVRSPNGTILGASKIARDISERKRAEEQQVLLIREMNHRVKNLFALAGAMVTISARTARDPAALAAAVRERLGALARAHSLTLPSIAGTGQEATTLHALIHTILSPYEGENGLGSRIRLKGPDVHVSAACVTSFALLLHEFATNAAKYGALSVPAGVVEIEISEEGENVVLRWTEHGGPPVRNEIDGEGFGSFLSRATVGGQLCGTISRDWAPDGLRIRLTAARERLEG